MPFLISFSNTPEYGSHLTDLGKLSLDSKCKCSLVDVAAHTDVILNEVYSS
jgi:hypothetical protein